MLNRGTNGFGFNIVGPNSDSEPAGIFVSVIKPNGSAAQQGELRVADQILAVNGRALTNLNHPAAAEAFRSAGDVLTLEVAQNPDGLKFYTSSRPVGVLAPVTV